MRTWFSVFILGLSLFGLSSSTGDEVIILNNKKPIQEQLVHESFRYIIATELDLNGKVINLPSDSEVYFRRRGRLKNGIIVGNDSKLAGNPRLECMLSGSFANEEIPVSWLSEDDSTLSNQIESIFNLLTPVTILVDKDIRMDGTVKKTHYVSFEGNHRITNSCTYNVAGNVNIKDVSISGFKKDKELFLSLSGITNSIAIIVKNIKFDGGGYISRFLYCPYVGGISESSVIIEGSFFSGVRNYILQFRSRCSGLINNNRVTNIGTDTISNVVGFHLGHSDIDLNAFGFEITNNVFSDFLVPYSEEHDAREAHAILVYGHNNLIRNNSVSNFTSGYTGDSNTGFDSEGIYIKGGYNVVDGNYLENCIGSSPDGAITIKTTHEGNVITNNIIKHQYGIGIQCYTPNSEIKGNIIESSYKAEAGIALVTNTETTIAANSFYSNQLEKAYHAAIALTRCANIWISDNSFVNTSAVITTYKCSNRINFETNTIILNNLIYGVNTYYTAPFEFHDDEALFVFRRNVFSASGTRASQLIEAPSSFLGELLFENNTIRIHSSNSIISTFTFLVRNVKRLTFNGNIDESDRVSIGKVSNLHPSIVIQRTN